MTDTYVSYAPGSWTLVARAGRYLLLETAPSDHAVNRLWTLLEGEELDALLDVLASALPTAGFCLVEVRDDGVRVAQHGVNALLDGRSIAADRAAQPVAVPEVGGMIMASSSAAAGEAQFPIESGVVAAGALLVVRVPAEAPAAEPEPEAPEPIDDLPVKVPEDLEPPAEVEVEEPEPVLTPNLWDDVPPYDENAVEQVPSDEEWAPQDVPVELAPDQAPAPSVPLTLADAPPPVAAPVPTDVGALSDGTVTGATVLAGYCLNGHLSGAYAPTCRVCGEPMPEQTPRTVPRPSLGVLVLENGDTFDLETGAVLGRAPRVPDEATETPLLVGLAAYGRDISRQHAEVVVHGWNVFVRDLGSANGTRVHQPDGTVITLEPNVAVPLAADSVLEIAEVTTVRFRTS